MSSLKNVYQAPTLAVLVSAFVTYALRDRVIYPLIQFLVEANKQINLNLYCFPANEIRLRKLKIYGIYYDGQKWLPAEFPFPDVLYIRGEITNMGLDIFESIFKNNGTKIINYPSFNKWQLHRVINNDPVLKRHLPITRTVMKPQDLEIMLQNFKTVYLKPHNGSQGKYVLRVENLSHERYLCSYYFKHKKKPVIEQVYGLQSLLYGIYDFFDGERFLIQQAIELIRYEDRLTDLRAELQRNGNGDLEIVGISARLGKSNSPITTHGDAYKFDYFYHEFLNYPPERVQEIQKRVNKFLFGIYECIEKKYGHYAEIGIDFAIDNNDKIWFIEANSQSVKKSLMKAYGNEILLKSSKKILEYSRYVAGLPTEIPG
ncbi:MAG: YheC/YheD family protein [Dethiobacteria bacterium]